MFTSKKVYHVVWIMINGIFLVKTKARYSLRVWVLFWVFFDRAAIVLNWYCQILYSASTWKYRIAKQNANLVIVCSQSNFIAYIRGVLRSMSCIYDETLAKIIRISYLMKSSIIDVWQGPKCTFGHCMYMNLWLMTNFYPYPLYKHTKCNFAIFHKNFMS